MNVREAVAAALTESLPAGWRVLGYGADLEQVTRPTVMLWQSLIERMPQIGLDLLKVTVEMWVLVGQESPDAASDALDDALDDVLEALQPLSWVDWTTAERGVLSDRFHGYRITAQAVAKIGA